MMNAIILAGGLGTRLRSVVGDMPKSLASINGRPFLDLLLHQLHETGSISKVILSVGYKAQDIIDRYKRSNHYHFKIEFVVEETPLGTGGAIQAAMEHCHTQEVLVLNGDSYVDFDLDSFTTFHKRKNKISILLIEMDDIRRYGNVEVEEDSQRILRFLEKSELPGKGRINAGIYILDAQTIQNIKLSPPFSFERDILNKQLPGEIFGYPTQGMFIDIGVPESYLFAQDYLKHKFEKI